MCRRGLCVFFRQRLRGVVVSHILVVVSLVLLFIPNGLIFGKSLESGGVGNYVAVIAQTPFLTFIRNSVIVSVITVAAVVVLVLCAAYALEILRPGGSWVQIGRASCRERVCQYV